MSIAEREVFNLEMLDKKVRVILNPQAAIFSGHFPGNPVVPGVIQLRIAIESASLMLNRTIQITEVKQAKYMQYINPGINNYLDCTCDIREEESGYRINAVLAAGEIVFSKLLLFCTLVKS